MSPRPHGLRVNTGQPEARWGGLEEEGAHVAADKPVAAEQQRGGGRLGEGGKPEDPNLRGEGTSQRREPPRSDPLGVALAT